jgi:hypothetical protein
MAVPKADDRYLPAPLPVVVHWLGEVFRPTPE